MICYLLRTENKPGKFLKKLWCCIDVKYYKIIWFYQLGLAPKKG